MAALIAVLLIFFLCMGFLQVSSGITNRLRASNHNQRAFELAEAGLAEGYFGLSSMKTGNVGSMAAPASIGDGLFWVEATELGNDIVELESTGMYGRGRVTLGLSVRRVRVLLSSLGVFSNQDFNVSPNTFLDSYDSSQGTYGEHVAAGTNNKTIVGSNGDVSLSSGSTVDGDVVYGASGSFSASGGATVTGTPVQRPASMPLPPVEVPTIPLAAPQTVSGGTTLVVPPGQAGFESLDVDGGSRAILTGPVTLVFGDLRMANSSILTFDNSGGPIDIYVTGELDLASGSVATTVSDDPNMVTIQVASDGSKNVNFGSSSLFYGQVYAPLAEVKVLPAFELFGNLVADSIQISANASMHYDLNTVPSRREIMPSMWSWRALDVPDAVAGRGMDPLQLLGLTKDSLLAPAAAHQDQQLVLEYIDLLGMPATYNGWESGFDWTGVQSVISGSRDNQSFTPQISADPSTSSSTEPALSPTEQTQSDLIKSAATSADLLAALTLDYPLSERILIEAIQRVPAMSKADLYSLLEPYGPYKSGFPTGQAPGPASDAILMAAITQPALESKELMWCLGQNSPLAPDVLNAALNRTPAMKVGDVNKLLGYQ